MPGDHYFGKVVRSLESALSSLFFEDTSGAERISFLRPFREETGDEDSVVVEGGRCYALDYRYS